MVLYYNLKGAERKALVKAIEEITGTKSKYLGAPTMAYQVGDYNIDREGALSWPDSIDTDPGLLSQLSERGFECSYPEYEEPTEFSISVPLEKVKLGNLLNLLEAKGELIKKALGIENTFIVEENEAVTFPWFTDLTPEEVETYTKFIAALCKMSREQKRVTAKAKEVENEKYAFRCFLLRLGFIGAEYKTDRKILLKNLEGSSAFKNTEKEVDE